MLILVTILVFAAMEGITWLTHKYVMHGMLWRLHRDHHLKDHGGFFERNDWFFLIFALPAMALFAAGRFWDSGVMVAVGSGITLYGVAYFVVHEVIIHRRFGSKFRMGGRYVKGIRRAHRMHHKHLGREKGECFGMLVVPFRYFRRKD